MRWGGNKVSTAIGGGVMGGAARPRDGRIRTCPPLAVFPSLPGFGWANSNSQNGNFRDASRMHPGYLQVVALMQPRRARRRTGATPSAYLTLAAAFFRA